LGRCWTLQPTSTDVDRRPTSGVRRPLGLDNRGSTENEEARRNGTRPGNRRALNWGLVTLAEFDLVAEIAGLEFGETNALTRVIYGLVGLSGLWLAIRAAELIGRDRERFSRVTA
jgi:uncharacterized membrane protein YuzA (DUF378 family)